MVYFVSDTHYDHSNIIKYTDRPFESCSEMNKEMIRRWNEIVSKDDVVYHLGDLTFGDTNRVKNLIDTLNGTIHFITGNHDRPTSKVRNEFASFQSYKEINIDQEDSNYPLTICLFHYPMEIWNKRHYGAIHLHGHEHTGVRLTGKNRVDVGVDSWNYRPVSLERIRYECDHGYPADNPFEDSHHK